MKLHWQNKWLTRLRLHNTTLSGLLFHTGSLTRYIEDKCNSTLQVELKSESWQQPLAEETSKLNLSGNEQAFVRESWLKTDGEYLIYARSIVPRDTYEQFSTPLKELGTRPLGELLFSDTSSYRAEMRYARVPGDCPLFNATLDHNDSKQPLWARQSLFYLKEKPLLILEVFLPNVDRVLQGS